ncbi:phospholipid phosphatase 5-like [Danaus plexippus]|uniref:phospholipid phosphatase 5-like n=1 Tax=Danaus plexippus TaxID=13037 RepID=UPI002AAF2C06|nr:phospholipid phosphatase 5-like [Danaus plexippus]
MDIIVLTTQAFRQIELVVPNLLRELSIRTTLLLVLIVLHVKYQPEAIYITDVEMLNEYRKPRRDSYVPPWATVLLIIFIPLIILSLPAILVRNTETFQPLLGWTLALLLNGIVTEALKLFVCRPRPDFFYRCYPTGVVSSELQSDDIQDIIEGRKSFPSGHSSFAFCSLGFLSLWLRKILCATSDNSVRINILCVTPLLVAFVIGVSRLCDNHHHWQDVLAGCIIGALISYICYTMYSTPENRPHNRTSHAHYDISGMQSTS